ncbi:hypothetical protein SLE2022_224480 [Rubroshorea leprosula]
MCSRHQRAATTESEGGQRWWNQLGFLSGAVSAPKSIGGRGRRRRRWGRKNGDVQRDGEVASCPVLYHMIPTT